MTILLLSLTSGDDPGSSLSPAVLCKYWSHSMAADQCDDLITSLLFHNTNFQPYTLIYRFLCDGAESEAVVSQQLNNQSTTAPFCDIHPLKNCTAMDESTEQHLLVNSGKVNELHSDAGNKSICEFYSLYRVNKQISDTYFLHRINIVWEPECSEEGH